MKDVPLSASVLSDISLPGTFDSVIISYALFVYFDVIIQDLTVLFADVGCEYSVSQRLTK